MKKWSNIVDLCLLTVGSTVALANIEQILGIIILAIQLIWILAKLVIKVVDKIKTGTPLEELDDEVKDLVDLIEDSKDKIGVKETDNE